MPNKDIEMDELRKKHQQKLIDAGTVEPIETLKVENFIKYCENEYGMKSEEFIKIYETEYEHDGPPDFKLWYSFIKNN